MPAMPVVRRRPLRYALGFVLALCAAAPALAATAAVSAIPLAVPATQALAPGVTYQRDVLAGGQVINVVRIAPHGLASLEPVVVSGAVGARGDLARTTRALAPTGAVASVNGDFFNFTQAYPSGLTITRAAGLVSAPNPLRSSLVIGPTGQLVLERAVLGASWMPIATDGSPLASMGDIGGINRPAAYPSEVILFSPAYGTAIAPLPAHLPTGTSGPVPTLEDSATIAPDAAGPLEPNQTVTGTVVANSSARSVRIPAGHLVLTGVGPAAASIAQRLPVGTRISLVARIAGIAPGTLALGGGPALVVAGRAVHNAGEGFVANQLNPRSERTAIGQTANGTDLLVSAEGPGEGSPGITVPEQADLMVRLGARTAIAMDSGGSSQMIVNGSDVMPWTDPRAIGTAAVVRYQGVRVSPLTVPLSPNGDGVDDTASVGVIVPSPGTLVVTLTAPHRRAVTLLDRAVPAVPVAVALDPRRLGLPDGTYHLNASLTTVLGAVSRDVQAIVVDRTLGGLATRAVLRDGQPEERIAFRLARAAVVAIRVTTRSGQVLAVLLRARRLAAGPHSFVWNQRRGRETVSGGADVVAQAATRFGTHGLIVPVVLAHTPRARG